MSRYIGATSRTQKGFYIPIIIDTVSHTQWPATTDLCRSFEECQNIANQEAANTNFMNEELPE